MSEFDYGNTKIASMHLNPGRRNVAAQVAEELKTVTTSLLWRNADFFFFLIPFVEFTS